MSGFGQDGSFLEDFDCPTVITVRVSRLKKRGGKKNPVPCLYLQSGGLVFQPAVYTLRKRLHFPQEAP